MPLPLIPAVLLGASALAGAKGSHDLYKANKKRKKAKTRKGAAEQRLANATRATEAAHEQLQDDYARLLLVQMSALSMLDEVVDWLKKGRITEHEWAALPEHDRPTAASWSETGTTASSALREAWKVMGAAGTGELAKQAAFHLGRASTGAAISGLSGAAARSATLAWLGGGSLAAGGGGMALGTTVLGSLNVGAAVFGAGLAARKVAAAYDASIADFEAAVDTDIRQMRSTRKLWRVMRQRFTQLRRATNAVARAVRTMLDQGDPTDDRQWLAMVHVAKAMASLSKTSPVDETQQLVAHWTNPYQLLGPIGLEPVDDDFIVEAADA